MAREMCALKGGPLWPYLGECGSSITGHCSSFSCCLSSIQNQDRHPLTDLPYLCLGRVPCATLKEGKPGPFCWGHTGLDSWQLMVLESLPQAVYGGESWAPTHTATQAFKATWPLGSELRGHCVNKVSLRKAKA